MYMSQTIASKSFQRLVSFIDNVYGPTWFHIKCNNGCQDESNNFFFHIKQRFAIKQYFAHSEHIAIAAVCDDNLDVRRQAVEIIISSRQRVQPNAVSIFDKNDVKPNFPAKTYFDMIDWDNCQVTLPPLLSHVSSNDLKTS